MILPYDHPSGQSPWELVEGAGDRSTGSSIYIAIAGNSAAGKSTVVELMTEELRRYRSDVIGIDETRLHHIFLDRLFHEPERYAFELQLNFMVQRSLVIKRWIDSGFDVVMERSHLEDLVFIRHLHRLGIISDLELDSYVHAWQALADRLPVPDVLVYLRLDPCTAIDRLTAAEDAGSRPREFRDYEQKSAWICGWSEQYAIRMRELLADDRYASRVLQLPADLSATQLAAAISDRVASLLTSGGIESGDADSVNTRVRG